MFAKVVNVVEWLALAAAAMFLVLMFTYRPPRPHIPAAAAGAGATGAPSGAAIYAANCSSCHGTHGEGDVGPKLGGGQVVTKFPNVAGEIAVVTNGEGSMPAWLGTLTADQIKAVVDYTRTGL